MNAGFSNLTSLKAQLLAAGLQGATDYDALITAIGLGVAGQFEQFCDRKFTRVVNDQQIISADRTQYMLSRFPIESVSLVELKLTEALGWQQLDVAPWNVLQTIDNKAGIICFPEANDLGPYYAQVRFTFTGGYFWEQLEPADPGYPTAVPVGSTAIPDSLRTAWILQCKHIWQTYDPLNLKISGESEKGVRVIPQQTFADMDLLPLVKETLGGYYRYQII